MSADYTTTVQNLYAAFGSGDIATFLNGLTNDAVWESRYTPDVPLSGTFSGKDAISGFIASIGEHVEITEFAPAEFLAGNDTVAVLGHEVAASRTTGVRYRNEWVHVFRFRDGKVYRIQTSNDAAAVQAAFNAV